MTINTGSAQSQEERTTRQETRQETRKDKPHEPTNLDYRYGDIGIEAVAAAAHYVGLGRRPAEAPAASQIDQRFIEVAI